MDGTAFALKHWCRRVRELYKSVDCHASYTWTYPTRDPYSTSVHRSKNKARLRQQALEAALTAGADYLLVSPEYQFVIFIMMLFSDIGCGLFPCQSKDSSHTYGRRQVRIYPPILPPIRDYSTGLLLLLCWILQNLQLFQTFGWPRMKWYQS